MALKVTIRYQAAGTLCGIVSVTSPRSCDSWDESWHEPLADEWAKRSGARGAVRADGNSINQSRSWSSHPPSQTVSPQGASVLISNTSVISFSVCVCVFWLVYVAVWLGRDERLCVWRNPTLWWRGLCSQLSLFSVPHERSEWLNLHNKLWKVFCRYTSGGLGHHRCPFRLISVCVGMYTRLCVRLICDVLPVVNAVSMLVHVNLI